MEIETSGLSVDKDAHGLEENTSRCTKKYRGRTSFFFLETGLLWWSSG